MGLIQKYFLPHEVDFNAALQEQAEAARDTVQVLCRACRDHDLAALTQITEDERRTRRLKNRNMRELLDVLITPYDREAIYRVVDQLDWVALSVHHFAVELLVYRVECTPDHKPVIDILDDMALALAEGFAFLAQRSAVEIVRAVNEIYVWYDEVVQRCAQLAAAHLRQDEVSVYLAHREIIAQLKEVARRLRVAAGSLEDLAIKMV